MILFVGTAAMLLPAMRTQPSTISMMAADAGHPSQMRTESTGTILEFEDEKKKSLHLGVVEAAEVKGKKGAVYQVRDSSNKLNTVLAKHIRATFASDKMVQPLEATNPDVVLPEYVAVSRQAADELGIDLDVLELAWEICLEEGHEEGHEGHTLGGIVAHVDPSLFETPVDQYRAHRLLSSAMGQVFFKKLHSHDYSHLEYKAKDDKAVASSKESFCKGEQKESAEWCMV